MKAYYCELQCKDKAGIVHPLIVSALAENDDDARAKIKDSMNFTSAQSDFGDVKEAILYRDIVAFPVGVAKQDLKVWPGAATDAS